VLQLMAGKMNITGKRCIRSCVRGSGHRYLVDRWSPGGVQQQERLQRGYKCLNWGVQGTMGCMYIPWNTVANSTIHHQEGGVVNMPQKGRKKKMGGEDRQNARAQRGQHCKCGYVTVHLAQIPEQGLNLNRS